MRGKDKCKNLREIRKMIAENNDIEYVVNECTFQGECKGTCPKCEAELKYLEEELAKRQKLGKNIAVAGIAAAMFTGMIGCTPVEDKNNYSSGGVETIVNEPQVLGGDMVYVPDDEPMDLEGKVAYIPEDEPMDLDGDIAYIPEEEEQNISETEDNLDAENEAGSETEGSSGSQNETDSAEGCLTTDGNGCENSDE